VRSTPSDPRSEARSGAVAAGVCYFLWGLVPLYWKPLASVDPVELVAHRHVWSLVLLLALLLGIEGGFREVRGALGSPRAAGRLLLSAVLLTANWLAYVWGVSTGRIVETSLGYFLVPLVNAAAGRFVLKEHLRRTQQAAIAVAAIGVGLMIVQAGRPPWIALLIAGTWGAYSLLRKQSPVGAIPGLAVETLLLAPLAAGYLGWRHYTGVGALGRVEAWTQVLILSAGIVTAVPLLLFAYAARRIRLTTLGLLQYLAPSVQLAIGVGLYHEPFPRSRMLCFAFIWVALALYTADNLIAQRALAAGQSTAGTLPPAGGIGETSSRAS